jgi:hypothetical protein
MTDQDEKDKITKQRIIDLLRSVLEGKLTPVFLSCSPSWCNNHPVGNAIYNIEDWRITIFWDGGEWDYIDNIITPEKEHFDDTLNDLLGWGLEDTGFSDVELEKLFSIFKKAGHE